MKSTVRNDYQMARRLLSLSEAKISEAGTPTTALPPSTDATRQMKQDMATSGTPGTPSPVGAEPNTNNPAAQGGLDVNGADAPVHDQPGPGKDTGHGVTVPQSRYNAGGEGPASGTDDAEKKPGDPRWDTSVGAQGEVAKASKKSGTGLRVEGMSIEDVLDALLEHFNGADDLMFALVAEGVEFDLAEAIVEGNVDLEEIEEGLRKFATRVLESTEAEPKDALREELSNLNEEQLAALLEYLIAEGFGDTLKKGLSSLASKVSGSKPSSAGYEAHKKKRLEVEKNKKLGSDRVLSTKKRDFGVGNEGDKPFKSFRKEGASARANK